ncbi:MAG TPA: hypothetical protein VGT07_04025 [Steroidobacteraceae bacterium]|nr:hypothetical protein [Steroidobacteraceae bacterium]
MLIEHAGKRPVIDASAWIAPDATVCGDVVIAAGARIRYILIRSDVGGASQ